MTQYQPLAGARTYLRMLYRIADDAGDWQERKLLGPLHDVADMVCRIGENTASDHYRADKAGPLVTAALKVRCAALERYAGVEEDDQDLAKVLRLEEALDDGISRVMWVLARRKCGGSGDLWRSDVDDLRFALRGLSGWVEKIAGTAVADPEN
jgi:hypothetical protein